MGNIYEYLHDVITMSFIFRFHYLLFSGNICYIQTKIEIIIILVISSVNCIDVLPTIYVMYLIIFEYNRLCLPLNIFMMSLRCHSYYIYLITYISFAVNRSDIEINIKLLLMSCRHYIDVLATSYEMLLMRNINI